jgi:ADP-ribosylglycohydrolase
MNAVWVVRDDGGNVMRVAPREHVAVAIAAEFGGTVTRESLLTPAHAAVIASAGVMAYAISEIEKHSYDEYKAASFNLVTAVATLRELEGA